jgi:HEPN domain
LSIDVGPDVTQCLTTPGVANYCFSIELFFKSLLAAREKPAPKTHKLHELFDLLAEEDRTSIRLAYEAVLSQPPLDELINLVSEYFVKLRYEYEFVIFALQEFPVMCQAKAAYVHAAKAHNLKTGHERIQI